MASDQPMPGMSWSSDEENTPLQIPPCLYLPLLFSESMNKRPTIIIWCWEKDEEEEDNEKQSEANFKKASDHILTKFGKNAYKYNYVHIFSRSADCQDRV